MSRPIRVLLVEDSELDAALLLLELRQNGYQPECQRVETAAEMTAALDRQSWDVVIADYVMPRFSGPAALKLMQRRELDLPFIIVSGHIDEDTAVASMKAGAHDYVMKDRLTRLVPAIEREMQEAANRAERREIEKEAAAELAFRHAIEASIPSGIAATDVQGALTYVNAAFCEMVGWTEEELKNVKSPYPFCPGSEVERLREAFARMAENDASQAGFELCFQHRNGKRFDVMLLIRSLKDAQGKRTGWLASVTDITQRKQAEEALRRAHDELELRVRERTADLEAANVELEKAIQERQRLEHELLDITEKERRRIGLDLHDDLGQKLAGITLMMKGLEVALRRKKSPEADAAKKIEVIIQQTVNHASNLAHNMVLADLPEKDLPTALAGLASNVKNLFDISCEFKSEGGIPPLEKNIIMQLYKITQEAVTNAVKHGKAREVGINLIGEPDRLILTVRNNGLPFPSMIDQRKGMGLRIMNYRASTIGGSLEVKADRPKGTLVTCSLPTKLKKSAKDKK
ncbi:MAG TPA: PAS domain S-box protein [Verrucomicrobiae bacterium]|nr:PAS domain S-box protein [Verrucomicrobiae bacterium]